MFPMKLLITTQGSGPTVKDRRPLVGIHPKYSQLAVLNGLGTRGVMIAPTVAKQLFEHLEYKKPLDQEIDILRCQKKDFQKDYIFKKKR